MVKKWSFSFGSCEKWPFSGIWFSITNGI
jgi:hypothetical protein